MPRILHICYPGVGGQAAVATGLAVEGINAGLDQTVVFYGVEKAAQQYLDRCEAEGIHTVSIVKQPGVGMKARKQLRDVINSNAPAVVVAHHHDMCITAATASHGKLIYVEHHSNALKTRKDWWLSCIAHRLSAHTVYLTESYQSRVKDVLGCLCNKAKTSMIGNGLDLDGYAVVAPRAEVKKIGMLGRMDQGKDFETLIGAFAEINGSAVTLELIGDGPDRSKLEGLAKEMGVESRVLFTGFLPQEELTRRMREWDVAVLATDGETLSMAILEAWALGIPQVLSDVPGVNDLVQDGVDGCLYKAGSVESLAKELQHMSSDLALRKQLAIAGRRRVEREYDRRVIWGKYESLIKQLISESAAMALETNYHKTSEHRLSS